LGAEELQIVLQEQHNCTIAYDTVWKGKEKAPTELYGTWEDNFKLLFRWKEAVFLVGSFVLLGHVYNDFVIVARPI
jgi:hypothetical protein